MDDSATCVEGDDEGIEEVALPQQGETWVGRHDRLNKPYDAYFARQFY